MQLWSAVLFNRTVLPAVVQLLDLNEPMGHSIETVSIGIYSYLFLCGPHAT